MIVITSTEYVQASKSAAHDYFIEAPNKRSKDTNNANLARFNSSHPQLPIEQLKANGFKTAENVISQKKSLPQKNNQFNYLDLAEPTIKNAGKNRGDGSQIIKIESYSQRSFEKPQSQEVLDIISSRTSKEKINQDLTDLIMQNSDNPQLILDIQQLPENSSELRSLAHEASNILSTLSSTKDANHKAFVLEIDRTNAIKNLKGSSQNPDIANIKTLYDHAIAQETAQKNIDIAMSDKIMTQEQKQNLLDMHKSSDQIKAQYETPAIKNKITSMYDEAINKITSQSPIEVLNLDIQALKIHSSDAWARYNISLKYGNFSNAKVYLDYYLSTTASILWKRGAVTKKSVAAMVKSVLTSSKVNVSAKEQKQVTDNAGANIPPKNASPTQVAQWIENYITQPISNLITKARGKNNSEVEATSPSTNS